MIFEENFSLVSKRFPDLAQKILSSETLDFTDRETANGQSIKIGKNPFLHDTIDPVKESEEWTEKLEKEIATMASGAVVLGSLGLGYQIEAIQKLSKIIVVIESNFSNLKTFLSVRKMAFLENENFFLFCKLNSDELFDTLSKFGFPDVAFFPRHVENFPYHFALLSLISERKKKISELPQAVFNHLKDINKNPDVEHFLKFILLRLEQN